MSEYQTLANQKREWNNGWTLAGAFFPAAGSISNKSLVNTGLEGDYWSNEAVGYENAARLYFNEGGLGVGSLSRYIGYNIRCIAKK